MGCDAADPPSEGRSITVCYLCAARAAGVNDGEAPLGVPPDNQASYTKARESQTERFSLMGSIKRRGGERRRTAASVAAEVLPCATAARWR